MISKATLGRLPLYLRYLKSLPRDIPVISATTIAKDLSLGEVQVRKDLASVCGSGKPKLGYPVDELTACMERILSGNLPKQAIVMGAGKLGMALLNFPGFLEYGISVVKAFDVDPAKWNDDVLPAEALASYCALHQIELGILTVPPQVADAAARSMVQCGIKAIWCFSSSHLDVPDEIIVHYENLALSLAHLQSKLSQL